MKLIEKYKKVHKKLLLAEIFMLFASVFIFRGLWTLLDMIPFMFTPVALWLSFIGGIIITIVCLRYIIESKRSVK